MTDVRQQRSLLNFAILMVVSTLTALFLLKKAQEAIDEIDRLSQSPAYLGIGAKKLDDPRESIR